MAEEDTGSGRAVARASLRLARMLGMELPMDTIENKEGMWRRSSGEWIKIEDMAWHHTCNAIRKMIRENWGSDLLHNPLFRNLVEHRKDLKRTIVLDE